MRRILTQRPEKWQGQHLLRCIHSLNANSKIYYLMYCDVLKEMPDRRLKVKVYGYRHLSIEGERIRYVCPSAVVLACEYGIPKD